MPAPKRIRRTLALRVSEPNRGLPVDTTSPGQRFATGWQMYAVHGALSSEGVSALCRNDPIHIAGFLAAKAAWDAHHYAVNWIEVAE